MRDRRATGPLTAANPAFPKIRLDDRCGSGPVTPVPQLQTPPIVAGFVLRAGQGPLLAVFDRSGRRVDRLLHLTRFPSVRASSMMKSGSSAILSPWKEPLIRTYSSPSSPRSSIPPARRSRCSAGSHAVAGLRANWACRGSRYSWVMQRGIWESWRKALFQPLDATTDRGRGGFQSLGCGTEAAGFHHGYKGFKFSIRISDCYALIDKIGPDAAKEH